MTQRNNNFKIDRMNRIISRKGLLLLILALGVNCFAYYGGRLLALDRYQIDMTTSLDRAIPIVPWMILIYLGCYLFWGINYLLSVRFDEKDAIHFVKAHVLGEIVCFLCFVFLPTTMERASIAGNGLMDQIFRLVYTVDEANNLFPSIHCYVSWLCWIGIRRNKKIPAWYRWFSFLFAVAICISTLTVKQHVIADVISGVLLAECAYWMTK